MLILCRSNCMARSKHPSDPVPFESVLQLDVPKGRDGKHKQIVTRLLKDIDSLKPGMALKVPLSQLPDTKENIRSALSRAAAQHEVDISTSSNDEFLYIWKKAEKETP
jgi:TusA-related sulfurtransferase